MHINVQASQIFLMVGLSLVESVIYMQMLHKYDWIYVPDAYKSFMYSTVDVYTKHIVHVICR